MKKTLILALSVAGAVGAYAQGTVNFAEAGDATILIYAPSGSGSGPNGEVVGNSAADTPSGSITYSGVPLGGGSTATGPTGYANGANYTAELYGLAGTTATTFSALQPLTQYQSHFSAKAAGAGLFLGSSPSPDPGVPNTGLAAGASATLSLAAWYNNGGTITSVAGAISAGVPYGWSPLFTISGLGGSGSPPATPPDLTSLQSFSLVSPASGVPEPGTIALCVMGAGALIARRRSSK